MVHRPSDSRLLTNLLSHEKEYSKSLLTLLTSSQSSLSSFSAYASSSSPHVSQAILSVAGAFAGADDALRRFASAVDQWREGLRDLKELEDEVGVVMRDREILVTRLIKVSKSQKPTRESLLVNTYNTQSHNGLPSSSSSISLKSDFSTNSKLSSAQAELQACEAHLAAKERELDFQRCNVVKHGLSVRCTAMVECGWVWGEMGKEGLRALEGIVESSQLQENNQRPTLSPQQSGNGNKPLPDPTRASSDLSSLAPSQSASQIACFSGGSGSDNTITTYPTSLPGSAYAAPLPSLPSSQSATGETILDLGPPHTLSDHAFYQSPMSLSLGLGSHKTHVLSRRITEEDLQQPPDEEEEEEEGGGSSAEEERELEKLVQEGDVQVVENPRFVQSSSSSSTKKAKEKAKKEKKRNSNTMGGGTKSKSDIGPLPTSNAPPSPSHDRAFSLRRPTKHHTSPSTHSLLEPLPLPLATNSNSTPSPNTNRARRSSSNTPATSGGGGFFGSLRVLFGSKKDTSLLRDPATFLPPSASAPTQTGTGTSASGGGGKWETRTERNLKGLSSQKADSDDDDDDERGGRTVVLRSSSPAPSPTRTPRARSPVSDAPGAGGSKRLKKSGSTKSAAGKGRKRTSSVPVPVPPVVQTPSVTVPVRTSVDEGVRRAEEWLARTPSASAVTFDAAGAVDDGEVGEEGEGEGEKTNTKKGKKKKKRTSSPSPSPSPTRASGSQIPTTLVVSSSGDKEANETLSRNSSLRSSGSGSGAGAKVRKSVIQESGEGKKGNNNIKSGSKTVMHGSDGLGVGSESLMSIVERGQQQQQPPQAQSQLPGSGSGSGSGSRRAQSPERESKPTPMPKMMDIPKAPVSLFGFTEGVESANPGASVGGSGGWAPPALFSTSASASSLSPNTRRVEGSGSGSESYFSPLPVEASPSPSNPSSPGSNNGSNSGSAGSVNGIGGGRGRTLMGPLRSAMKGGSAGSGTPGSSRTASPMVGGGRNLMSLPASVSAAAAAVVQGVKGVVNGSADAGVNADAKGKAKAKGSPPPSALSQGDAVDDDDDDTASISSYETATGGPDVPEKEKERLLNGVVHDEEDGSDIEGSGSTSTSTEDGTIMTAREEGSPRIPSPIPTAPLSAPVPTASRARASPLPPATAPTTAAGASAGIPPPPPAKPTPAPVHEDTILGEPTQLPKRRKSVRVSLQPTFSPTPPAIYDDDEGGDGDRYAPWSSGSTAAASGTKGSGSKGWNMRNGNNSGGDHHHTGGHTGGRGGKGANKQHQRDGVSGGTGEGEDMWQDSSEEDEEYSKARKLLSKVGVGSWGHGSGHGRKGR